MTHPRVERSAIYPKHGGEQQTNAFIFDPHAKTT